MPHQIFFFPLQKVKYILTVEKFQEKEQSPIIFLFWKIVAIVNVLVFFLLVSFGAYFNVVEVKL